MTSTRCALQSGMRLDAISRATRTSERGATDLRTFSPSGKGAAFALRHGAHLEHSIAEAIEHADVVITATTRVAVLPQHFAQAGGRRIVIDLGLPRNVDPLVTSVAGVELLDLETVRLHAPLDLLAPAIDARGLVGAAAAEFHAEAEVEPAIVAFRGHVLELLDAELGRRAHSPETEAALRHMVGVIVHGPSARARELAIEGRGAEFATAVETVFGIQPAAAASADADEKLA